MSNPSDQLAQKPSFKWEAQRILILDKDDQFRFMARTMFQRQRTNEVLSTASMAEAVLHLMASPVNACLVGVAENEPAGIEFLRWLRDRKASPCPDVPVTALTESKDPAFIHKICRFGIEGLLRKPVSQEGLTRRVSQMILEPKRMVIAPGYLGPDRRNGESGEAFSGQDRRRPSEPVFTDDRPKSIVVQTAAKPPPPKAEAAKPMPNAVAAAPSPPPAPPPRPTAPQAPPLTVASRPAAPPPPVPAVAKPVAPPPPPATKPVAPPVPMAVPAQPARPVAPPPAVAARPATPAAPAAPVYKPSASSAKLELGELAPTPTAQAGTKLAMDAAPATLKPTIVVVPSPPAPPASVSPMPEKPKVKPAKLTFDLNGVLDGHRNWVLSRGTEGGRATLSRQNMTGVDLSGAILTQADLTYCRLTGAECSEAKLDGADLRYAEMAGADLTEAVLGASRLRHVNLAGAKLKGANLRGADLSGADLRGADLEGAQMHGATLLDTLISDSDLSAAEGLTQAQINKTKRNLKTKLPPGLRLNLGEEEAVAVAEAS